MISAITIAVTRHGEDDRIVSQCLARATASQNVEGEVIFLDQKGGKAGEALAAKIGKGRLPLRVLDGKPMGLSEARNILVREARHDIILFLDADAFPRRSWASRMRDALCRGASIAGSRILPSWDGKPPFPALSSIVREQYSMLDLGRGIVSVEKVVGAGFGVHRGKLGDIVRFDTSLGRQGGRLIGGEETDLCERAIAAGHKVHYEGRAVVYHHVSRERLKWKWLIKRFLAAGESRAMRQGAPAPFSKPGLKDWFLAFPLLPFYVAGYARAKKRLRGDKNKDGREAA